MLVINPLNINAKKNLVMLNIWIRLISRTISCRY